jgi:hypothetical protein
VARTSLCGLANTRTLFGEPLLGRDMLLERTHHTHKLGPLWDWVDPFGHCPGGFECVRGSFRGIGFLVRSNIICLIVAWFEVALSFDSPSTNRWLTSHTPKFLSKIDVNRENSSAIWGAWN